MYRFNNLILLTMCLSACAGSSSKPLPSRDPARAVERSEYQVYVAERIQYAADGDGFHFEYCVNEICGQIGTKKIYTPAEVEVLKSQLKATSYSILRELGQVINTTLPKSGSLTHFFLGRVLNAQAPLVAICYSRGLYEEINSKKETSNSQKYQFLNSEERCGGIREDNPKNTLKFYAQEITKLINR